MIIQQHIRSVNNAVIMQCNGDGDSFVFHELLKSVVALYSTTNPWEAMSFAKSTTSDEYRQIKYVLQPQTVI